MKRFLDDWSGAFEDRNIEAESLHDAGDRVVCVCHQTARAKLAKLQVDMRFAMYADPAEAFAATGVEA